MNPFYEQLLTALDQNERFALATVVRTIGSTPQKAGARALFFGNGRIVGTLGGGCMEAEARQRALRSLREGGAFAFDLQLDSDFGWDDGLICGGTASLLIQPDVRPQQAIFTELIRAMKEGERAVLATVILSESAPSGATMLFRSNAPPIGDALPESLQTSIGEAAQEYLDAPWQESRAVTLAGQRGQVYLEPHYPKPSLFILGGGHVGAALARIASRIEFDVTVIDDRASFVNRERFPEVGTLLIDEITEGFKQCRVRPDSSVVIVTRGHQHDAEALREALKTPAAYVGMIGSRRKVHVIFQSLMEEGFATPEQLRRVRAPIGLDLGGQSVEEIAVSIAAELIAVRARLRAGDDPESLDPSRESYSVMAARRSPKSVEAPALAETSEP